MLFTNLTNCVSELASSSPYRYFDSKEVSPSLAQHILSSGLAFSNGYGGGLGPSQAKTSYFQPACSNAKTNSKVSNSFKGLSGSTCMQVSGLCKTKAADSNAMPLSVTCQDSWAKLPLRTTPCSSRVLKAPFTPAEDDAGGHEVLEGAWPSTRNNQTAYDCTSVC